MNPESAVVAIAIITFTYTGALLWLMDQDPKAASEQSRATAVTASSSMVEESMQKAPTAPWALIMEHVVLVMEVKSSISMAVT